MLHITSCLFATVVVRAYYLDLAVYHHLFLVVTVLSLLFHCTHHAVWRVADKCAAHGSFLYILLNDSPLAFEMGKAWVVLFPLSVAVLWFGQSSLSRLLSVSTDTVHAILHVMAAAGLHFYMHELYSL
jgi:hypothetical protein